jgi:sugar lactone lactonase YvrE
MMRSRAALAALLVTACATVAAPASADIPINGSRVHPESITSDGAGNIYTGSTGGTIYRAVPGGAAAEPWIRPDDANGLTSVFGVFAHDPSGTLWVCNNPPFGAGPPQPGAQPPARPSLKAFDLATGALKATYAFPGEGAAICNDIAVGPRGMTFATDTSGGKIFTLAPGATALTVMAADPELVGIDGIAVTQDGAIYINNVRKNTMQRVNRNGTAFAGLTTLTLSETVSGPDGLRWIGGNRFLQAEGTAGRVTYVDIEGDTARITPIRTGLESSPGVTRVGNTGYATEGKINYLFDPALRDKSPDPFIIRAFPLPE